jgi:hypothetical protein
VRPHLSRRRQPGAHSEGYARLRGAARAGDFSLGQHKRAARPPQDYQLRHFLRSARERSTTVIPWITASYHPPSDRSVVGDAKLTGRRHAPVVAART